MNPTDLDAGCAAASRTSGAPVSPRRRLPVGAEPMPEGGVHFRVWAPAARGCSIQLLGPGDAPLTSVPLASEPGGYFSGCAATAGAGSRYKIECGAGAYPDPVSRFQPEGPHGPSEVVDPSFPWTDQAWRGRPAAEWVMYELHLGTFTPEGTWAAARRQLRRLAELGITVVEIMPVADFPGRFGWGYDGVALFAPCRIYGGPDDARAFIDHAHELGLMVILDVVYNHVGPDGNYLKEFSPDYFSTRYANEWGEPMNFDGPSSAPVREFFLCNARYWIDEYHFDGLRLDATQQIFDRSAVHILAEISATVRAAAGQRQLCLVAENECQHANLARPAAAGGFGLDALWNDDFHHAAMVAATGNAEAYYSGYRGDAQEFISCVKRGFLYQGQWYRWQRHRRGHPALDLDPLRFVVFLQNHDQVANSLRGERLDRLTSPGQLRALTALLLLGPQVPLLFQGQEFGSSAPFLFFADHGPELAEKVRAGRTGFLRQFSSIDRPEAQAVLAPPESAETYERCKLDPAEVMRDSASLRLHRDLLRLRRAEATLRQFSVIDGAVLTREAFAIRFFSETDDDRLLLVNLGSDLRLDVAPEPLLAPLLGRGWSVLWSSESPEYGGGGTPAVETTDGWRLPRHSAVFLKPDEDRDLPRARLSEKD